MTSGRFNPVSGEPVQFARAHGSRGNRAVALNLLRQKGLAWVEERDRVARLADTFGVRHASRVSGVPESTLRASAKRFRRFRQQWGERWWIDFINESQTSRPLNQRP